MISFTPTEEQQLLIDTIRRYALNDVRPLAHDADEQDYFSDDVVQKGWELGLVATAVPEEYGGLGELSAITGVLAVEELAYGDLALAMKMLTPSLFAYPIILYGTDEQKSTYLPQFADVEAPPASAALLEPGIFFDPHELKTTATTDGDTVTLNGEKAYVPNAARAQSLLVYACDSESGAVDAYLVETGLDGLEVADEREKLMGIRALSTYRVAFNNVTVDATCRLGGAAGCDYDALLNRNRVALAAMATGVARAASEYARTYAKERVQFGVPIAQKQAVAFMLAEAAIEVDAMRLLAWEAAWKLDRNEDATQQAYLAKQYADAAVLQVTDSALQVLGGHGFIREHPVERWLRNGRGFTTFDGLAIV